MELFYFRWCPHGNFGDDLNEWLWDHLLPGWQTWDGTAVLVGAGSVLQQQILPPDRRKLVIGAGAGYGTIPKPADDPALWEVRAVRGALTADALGLPPEAGIIDPAALLSDLDEFGQVDAHGETLFVPHHHSATTADWATALAGSGITVLSPTGDARTVIRRIAGARRVIAESLHAAIVADTFRVPWQAVQFTRRFNHFKWRDWGYSVEMEPPVRSLVPDLQTQPGARMAVALRSLTEIAHGDYHLSDERVLRRRKQALWRVLEAVRADYSTA